MYYIKLLNLESIPFTAMDNTKAETEAKGFPLRVKHTLDFAPLGSGSDLPGNNFTHQNYFLVTSEPTLPFGSFACLFAVYFYFLLMLIVQSWMNELCG